MAVKRAFIDAESPPSAERSALMARVSSRDTRPEMAVRRAAHALGLRYRLHRRDLPGTPDLVFARFRTVVFIHGCFWHRHVGCKHASFPKRRAEFWREKFEKNTKRDGRINQALCELGWRTLIIWECETRNPVLLEDVLRGFLKGTA